MLNDYHNFKLKEMSGGLTNKSTATNREERIAELKAWIAEWDELAKDNPDNVHNLSTSECQDWVDELLDLLREEREEKKKK